MFIQPKLVRSAYIWKTLKDIIEEKKITLNEVADKLWTYYTALSPVLNWKKSWADKLFIKIAKAIWLSDSEIEKIFFEADWEELIYKYWDKIPSNQKITVDEALSFIRNHANLSEAEKLVLNEIKNKN